MGERDGDGGWIGARVVHSAGDATAISRVIDERYVDRVAGQRNISVRTGCFCNPGAGEVAFTISRERLLGGEFGQAMTLEDYIEQIGLPSGGAIRASFGLASNVADLHHFLDFAHHFVDLTTIPDDVPRRIAGWPAPHRRRLGGMSHSAAVDLSVEPAECVSRTGRRGPPGRGYVGNS